MKLIGSSISKIALTASILIFGAPLAFAADITLLCAGALESWMHEVIPAYHNSSGHNVKATFAVINAITERVRKGGAADVAIVSPQQWDDLQKEGKLDPAVRFLIAKVGYGVFAKSGTLKPDIDSVEALKRTLLNAKSIAVFDPSVVGPTAVYVARLFGRLGIKSDLQPKFKYSLSGAIPGRPTAAALFDSVATGDVEIGVAMISEIVAAQGVQLIGPVPTEVQSYQAYATVMPLSAREPTGAKAFIDFLTSPEAISILKSKGLEPG
jgi:molybdate transport system substrate-binding protein